MIQTFISTIFVGSNSAYIYIWVSKTHRVIYVGMTNGRIGTLGRASQHLDNNGTLRTNFIDSLGYSIDLTDDFILLSFKLPVKKEFISLERSYREAVEFLVQKQLEILRGRFAPTFQVISRIRKSPRLGNAVVKKSARRIVEQFIDVYPTL